MLFSVVIVTGPTIVVECQNVEKVQMTHTKSFYKIQVSIYRATCIYIYANCKYTWPNPYSYQSNSLKN